MHFWTEGLRFSLPIGWRLPSVSCCVVPPNIATHFLKDTEGESLFARQWHCLLYHNRGNDIHHLSCILLVKKKSQVLGQEERSTEGQGQQEAVSREPPLSLSITNSVVMKSAFCGVYSRCLALSPSPACSRVRKLL